MSSIADAVSQRKRTRDDPPADELAASESGTCESQVSPSQLTQLTDTSNGSSLTKEVRDTASRILADAKQWTKEIASPLLLVPKKADGTVEFVSADTADCICLLCSRKVRLKLAAPYATEGGLYSRPS